MSYEGVHDAETIIRKAKMMLQSKSNGPIPACIKQLVYHPRMKRIAFRRTGDMKSFVIDGHLNFSGLTKRIGKRFWKSRIAPSVSNKISTAIEKRVPRCASGCYHGGKTSAHGRKVHHDFHRLVDAIRKPLHKSGGVPYVGKVDPCAYRLMSSMLQNGWVPLKSEFCVFDEHLRIATAIDCIAWDIRNRAGILIEIKTGHESMDNYEATSGKIHLLGPLSKIPDSPLNRAAIQLTITLLMILRRYDIRFDGAAILRPRSRTKDVQTYNLPQWILLPELQCSMYAQLKETVGIDIERRFFRKPEGEAQRAALELQEAAQKEIEVGPDPKADVSWGVRESKNKPKMKSEVQLMRIPESTKACEKEEIEVPEEIVLSELEDLLMQCVQAMPKNPVEAESEQAVDPGSEFESLFSSSFQAQAQAQAQAHSSDKQKRKRKRKESEKTKIKKRKKMVKIGRMNTSWANELDKMGVEILY